MIKGIDISHWNDKNVIKNMAKDEKFVIIKASEGASTADLMAPTFAEEALAAGKLIGFYHFAHPELNSYDKEVNNFLSRIQSYVDAKKCVMVLDWEGKATGCSPTWAINWLTEVYNRTGIKPMLYISESELPHMAPVAAHDFGLWVAKWVKSTTVGQIPTVRPSSGAWKFWAMWQYSNGDGKLDYNVFNGTKAQFKKYQGR